MANLHTEEEAGQKWCPMARFGSEEKSTRNRQGDGAHQFCHCIASECMVWREVEDGPDKGKGYCALASGLIL